MLKPGALKWSALLLLVLCSALRAQEHDTRIDDSDLTVDGGGSFRWVEQNLSPDQIEVIAPDFGVSIEVVRMVNNTPVPVGGLPVSFLDSVNWMDTVVAGEDGRTQSVSCTPGQTVNGVITLNSGYFSVSGGSNGFSRGEEYRVVFEVPCGYRSRLVFQSDSDGGQALGIWDVAYRAQTKLARSVGLDFWHQPLPFVWPADGDYYSWGTVHITRGDHWDVVGHEMGHAIYDMAYLGVFGSGQHRIDECYSLALALSEGWASYFAAWVNIDPADPDAKFEFMVPRRAPIRIEHVPGDVCNGPESEWRVTSFFWDLVDSNNDGEATNEEFARVWTPLYRTRSRSVEDVAERLERAGFGTDKIDLVWMLNFRTQR